MEAKVVYNQDVAFEEAGCGVKRKVLAYTPDMMMVEVHFEKGGVGTPHTHPHLQSTYVRSGRFRFDIAGEAVVVAEGDTIAFPPEVLHGTLCLEAGILVDVFHPMRSDFL